MTKSQKAARPAKSGAHNISKGKTEKLARRQVTEFDQTEFRSYTTAPSIRSY